MGVINITQRRETLGNLGSTGMAHGATSTDIGRVHHTTPGIYAPRYFAKNSHAGDAALGRAIGELVDVAAMIGRREDERQCDKIVLETMKNVDIMDRDDRDMTAETIGNAPDKKHLIGQKRGCLLRTGEGTKGLPEEADTLYLETFENICSAFDATDNQRQLAAMRLAGYRRSRLDRMLNLQANEYRRMELGGAEGQLTQFITAWKNGNTGVVGDIFQAQEKLGILQLKTPEQRKADSQGLAVALAQDLAMSQMAKCGGRGDFDDLRKAIETDFEKRLPDALVAELPGRKVDDVTKKTLMRAVTDGKRRFVAEKTEAVNDLFDKQEADYFNGSPKPDTWAATVESWANDPDLKEYNPKRAKQFEDWAKAIRESERVGRIIKYPLGKGEYKGAVAQKILAYEILQDPSSELSADFLTGADGRAMSRGEKLQALRQEIRQDLTTGATAKWLNEEEYGHLSGRFSKQLDRRQQTALKRLYSSFGVNVSSLALTDKGNLTASDYKSVVQQYDDADRNDAPILQGLTPDQLVRFSDRLITLLDEHGDKYDEVEAVDRVISDMKVEWLKDGNFDRQIERSMRIVTDYMIGSEAAAMPRK